MTENDKETVKEEYNEEAFVYNEEAFVSKLDDKESYELIKNYLKDKYTQEEIHKMYNRINVFPLYTNGEVVAYYYEIQSVSNTMNCGADAPCA